jgi:5-deoxy-glucuronate isomerase
VTAHPSSLLVPPDPAAEEYVRITPDSAGWEHLSFAARRLGRGRTWEHATNDAEMALVVLGGVCAVHSDRGDWPSVGRRPDVFSGMPYALYLPRQTRFRLEALSDGLDIAYGWASTTEDHPARLIMPEQVGMELRGGDNASRQINSMLPPGFDCARLVVVEVYTPSGNWSSYPPHKHDVHRVGDGGKLIEADLEEVYFYKFDRPEGYAYQRIYTADGGRDELVMARNDPAVLSPEGYHPVVTAPGFNCYYLNMLAGSAQSLAATDDPRYTWVKSTWTGLDPRVPVVSMDMEH